MKDTIQCLIIGGNRICDNGMKQIAERFQHNHSLKLPHDLLPHGGKEKRKGENEEPQSQKGFIDISITLYNDFQNY